MLKYMPKWVDMHINLEKPMPLQSLTLPTDIDEQLCEVHVPCFQLKVMVRSWILWLLTTVVQLQNTHIVATPLWPSVGVKPNTSKVGDLESSGTPECLELNNKAQNTSH
jgi:hypothetical protein